MRPLPLVEGAELVVRGRIAKAETDQGVVVDYHLLRVTFDPLEVVKALQDQRREVERDRTVTVLQGTSWDAWLAQALRRDLEQLRRTGEVRTFVFVACDLHLSFDRAEGSGAGFGVRRGAADCRRRVRPAYTLKGAPLTPYAPPP